MPNNKVKSLKKLGAIGNVHPYSRKAKQARRAIARDDRLAKGADERRIHVTNPLVDRLRFMQTAIQKVNDPVLTSAQMYTLIEAWLHRLDTDLAQMHADRSKAVHGTMSSREDLMRAMVVRERAEYLAHGILMPNLKAANVVHVLRLWKGDLNQLDLIKTVLVRPPTLKPAV